MTLALCVVGTSLVNQGDVNSLGRVSHTTKSWLSWAEKLSGRCWSPVWGDPTVVTGWEPSGVAGATRAFWGLNAGVSGQTSEQVYARKEAVAGIDADYHVIDMGTNDVGTALTAQEIHAFRVAMVEFLLLRGRKPILLTVLTREVTSWPAGEIRDKLHTVNFLTKKTYGPDPRVIVHDWNDGWVDPASPEAEPFPGWSVDGTHFNGKGAFAVGSKFADLIRALSPPVASRAPADGDQYDATTNPTGNVIDNGGLDGTGGLLAGGATGDVADDWKVEIASGDCAVVASKHPDTGDQVLTITPGTTGTSLVYLRTASADHAHTLAGEWVTGGMDLEVVAGAAPLVGLMLYYKDQGTDGTTQRDMLQTADNFTDEAFSARYQLPPGKLVDDSTTARYRLEILIDNTQSGDVVIQARNGWVRRTDPPYVQFGTSAPGSLVVAGSVPVTTARGIRSPGDAVTVGDVGGDYAILGDMLRAGKLTRG